MSFSSADERAVGFLVEMLEPMAVSIGVTYPPVPRVLGVSPHGIFAAVGIAVAVMMLNSEIRRRQLALLPAIDTALLWAVPVGIVGARVDYVLSHLGDFRSISAVIAVWDGGLALFGGLLAGSATAAYVLHCRGAHVARVFDVAAPAFAIAIAVGRIGDLMIVDHLGKPISGSVFALAYQVRRGYHLAPGYGTTFAAPPGAGQSCQDVGAYFAGCSYHLTAAYDLAGAAVLAGALLLARRRLRLRSGSAIFLFALWYGTQRLTVDFTRSLDEDALFGLSGTQLLSLIWILVAITVLMLSFLRHRGLGDPPEAAPSAVAPLVRDTDQVLTR